MNLNDDESIVPRPSAEADDALGAGQAERFRAEHGLGELKAAVSVDRENHTVCIDYGKSVRFLAMSADQAERLGLVLTAMAERARR